MAVRLPPWGGHQSRWVTLLPSQTVGQEGRLWPPPERSGKTREGGPCEERSVPSAGGAESPGDGRELPVFLAVASPGPSMESGTRCPSRASRVRKWMRHGRKRVRRLQPARQMAADARSPVCRAGGARHTLLPNNDFLIINYDSVSTRHASCVH